MLSDNRRSATVVFSAIGPTDWTSRPVAIVGCGPSLAGFDLERLRERFTVLAVKGAIFDMPWADAGFGLDCVRLNTWWSDVTRIAMPTIWAVPDSMAGRCPIQPSPQMKFVRRSPSSVLSIDPRFVTSNGSSGFGALNVATLRGARDVVLLGYDYQGDGHYNPQHYQACGAGKPNAWPSWAAAFDGTSRVLRRMGVRVRNACPDSAITAFPRVTIESILK